jgi:hypothetical protein
MSASKVREQVAEVLESVSKERAGFAASLSGHRDRKIVVKLLRQRVCDPEIAELVHFKTDLFEEIIVDALILQVVCNAVTSSDKVADAVWNGLVESGKVCRMIQSHEEPCIIEPICAMIYNMSVRSEWKQSQLYSSEFGVEIIQILILKSISGQRNFEDLEESFFWIFVILKKIFTSGFVQTFYRRNLEIPLKIALLNVFHSLIKDSAAEDELGTYAKQCLSIFIRDLLEYSDSQVNYFEKDSIDLIYHTIEVITQAITHLDTSLMREFSQFLVSFLNNIYSFNEKSCKRLERQMRRERNEGLFYGIESSAMRMIAITANHYNEFCVAFGEQGGVEAVLNRCIIDEQNPYIREWSILAIRNLTKNCRSNQEKIRSLEKITDKNVIERLQTQIGTKK